MPEPNKSVKRDAPPVGGFEVLFFIKVRRLRLTSVSGAPLTVTLNRHPRQTEEI